MEQYIKNQWGKIVLVMKVVSRKGPLSFNKSNGTK